MIVENKARIFSRDSAYQSSYKGFLAGYRYAGVMSTKYKVGDKVKVRFYGGSVKEATIENIEWDEGKQDFVADLDCNNWCYLDQIIKKL